jgi:phospholipid/cholesterol/gamma-HCH transport system substrate-binding protein
MSSKKKILVGVFIVGGIILFAVGLFFIGSSQQLFASQFTVYTTFDNVDTIQPGAKVRVSGMDAGTVGGIQIPKSPSGQFRVKLEIDKKFHQLVRQDSVATIETAGMVGSKFVNVKKGSAQSPEVPAGGTLHGQEPVDLGDLMREGSGLVKTAEDTMNDIRGKADQAIGNITKLAGNANGMVVSVRGNVKKITSNTAHLTGNANVIAAGIREGHGAAGKLLTDPTVASNVAATISQAKQTAQKVNAMMSNVRQQDLPAAHKTLQNTQQMTGRLNQAVGTFLASGKKNENTAVALRDTVHGAKRTMQNLADDTEAIKHNFLFRGFFHRRGFYSFDTLTPKKYASSRFVKKPQARVWIAAAGLFQKGPEGKQQLTKEGRTILDQNMSGLVPYLPRNPVMVEGYASKGMPDQRYLASRERAVAVRHYLISRFHLDPKRIGIMPMADQPPKRTQKKVWNGICLVLVVSKHQ